MKTIDYPGLINRITQATEDVTRTFSTLNERQLNFRPDERSWSIAQCLYHVMKTNRAYMPGLMRATSPSFEMKFWEKHSPFSRSIGKSMVAQLGSSSAKKFRTPQIFNPGKPKRVDHVVSEFIAHQVELEALYRSLETSGKENCNLTSPASGLITLPLRDVVVLLVEHEQRHLNQAMRVLRHPGFPA